MGFDASRSPLGIGYSRPTTPALAALADDAVRFETAIAQHNWTSPSYASVFTSLHNWEFPGLAMGPAQLTLPEILQTHGYQTFGLVQNPNLSATYHFDQGFDSYLEAREDETPAEMTRLAIQTLEPLIGSEAPFFMFVHYQGPHWPYQADATYAAQFERDDSTLVNRNTIAALMSSHGTNWDPSAPDAEARVRHMLDLYDGDIRETDAALQLFVDWLKGHSLWRETLLIFNADHGDEFNDRGSFGHAHRNLHPELTYVPLIIRFPDSMGIAPRAVTAPVQNVDILPTVLTTIGIDVPDDLSGRSLLPLDGIDSLDRLTFSNVGQYVAVRSRHHALIGDFTRWPSDGRFRFSFYDLQRDPQEREPLPNPEEHPAFVRLRSAVLSWLAFYENQQARLASQPAQPPQIDDRLRERLRSLGYVR